MSIGSAPFLETFIDGLDTSFNEPADSLAESIPERIFMGFGYNGNLAEKGERLGMLQYFSWMDNLSDAMDVTIWDASSYQIVNHRLDYALKEASNSQTGSLSSRVPSADETLGILEEKIQDRPDLRVDLEARETYLRRLNSFTGVDAEYINAWDLFDDPAFVDAFDEALALTDAAVAESVRDAVIPHRAGLSGKLYLPLEIAEALYLQEEHDVYGKFGPETEVCFDEAILQSQAARDVPYMTLRCLSPANVVALRRPRSHSSFHLNPPYLSDGTDRAIRSRDSPDMVREKLSDEYRAFLRPFLNSHVRPGDTMSETLQRVGARLEGEDG
ncbi:MAG: hypothetical protein ABEI52_10765 [Halobacteriaceae archaeon]